MLLPFFAQRAADQLIDRQALVAEAQHLGLQVDAAEIKDELQHGRYADDLSSPAATSSAKRNTKNLLQQHNLTPAMFEDNVGKDILIGKLQALITGSASVSDAAIRQEFDKQNTKVSSITPS